MSCCIRMQLNAPPSSSILCSSASECMCMSKYDSECIFVEFSPLSFIFLWWHKSTKASVLDQCYLCVRSLVSFTVEKSGPSSQVSTNRIINFLSKEDTLSRFKRGELWREHALMPFMTLQIMHYRQEQNGDLKHNCIDFSLKATNNDISLDPEEEQEGM